MGDKPDLSVVIPAFNEARRIGPTLEAVSSYLEMQRIGYDIIVVSDGSTDSTDSIVESYARKDPRIRLLSYKPNRGKGYAVRAGMMSALAQDVLLTDADLATPIEDLERLQEAAGTGCDVIIASRTLSDAVIGGWRPWYRELSGLVFNRLVQLLAVPGISDTQCGFKLFKNGSAHKIFSVARLNGFGFDVEALFLARKFGYTVGEKGAHWDNSPTTKVSVFKDTLPMLIEVIKVRVNDWKNRYESPPSRD